MTTTIPSIHDVDEQELADLLRNLAYGIEEGDVPITKLKVVTEVEEPMTVALALNYHPPNELLIPSVRLTSEDGE